MHNVLREKSKEALMALLPITIIVLILNFTITPMPFAVRGFFIIGAILLVIGMSFFTLGADMAMMPIGEYLGQYLSKSKKLWLIVGASLLMGTMVTIAEPDLQILARQVPGVPSGILTVTVAVGLGLFLVIAMLRIIFRWSMSYLLAFLYVGVLVLGIFVPKEYLAVSFDAGGVTTGPFASPFILSLGIGVSAVRGGKSSGDDSFGLAALCSIGPIFAVMILGFLFKPMESTMSSEDVAAIDSFDELIGAFLHGFPEYLHEIGLAVAPLIAVFILFQIFALKLPKAQIIRIGIGLLYTYIGLSVFLTGVGVGFLPAGTFIGQYVGALDYNWVLIPLGVLMGFFIVLAEPAVHVLVEQVEDLTGGAITRNTMLRAFSISVGLSVGLAMIRVLTGVSIWWMLGPGYGLAILLSFFVPKIFTAVAFDSGAVASGPMTATFLLPFTMGACAAAGGSIMLDAFGVVAMVAMTPLFTVQIIGFIYNVKLKHTKKEELEAYEGLADDIEEQQFVDWAVQLQASEVNDDFESQMDMEFVASPEWAELVRNDQVHQTIAADNKYIDFDEYEHDRFESLVKAEDFDLPGIHETKDPEKESTPEEDYRLYMSER
ncbi:MAG: DUF1538 domain-containing protein [Clostridiales Family XIII bacterium]|nr:DUF1538 domain-containing protein [Clostridiales Family XIII bacterium]